MRKEIFKIEDLVKYGSLNGKSLSIDRISKAVSKSLELGYIESDVKFNLEDVKKIFLTGAYKSAYDYFFNNINERDKSIDNNLIDLIENSESSSANILNNDSERISNLSFDDSFFSGSFQSGLSSNELNSYDDLVEISKVLFKFGLTSRDILLSAKNQKFNLSLESLEGGYIMSFGGYIMRYDKDLMKWQFITKDEYNTYLKSVSNRVSSNWEDILDDSELDNILSKRDLLLLNSKVNEYTNEVTNNFFIEIGVTLDNELYLVNERFNFGGAVKYSYKLVNSNTLLYFLRENNLFNELQNLEKEIENKYQIKHQNGIYYEDSGLTIKKALIGNDEIRFYYKDGYIQSFKRVTSFSVPKSPSTPKVRTLADRLKDKNKLQAS